MLDAGRIGGEKKRIGQARAQGLSTGLGQHRRLPHARGDDLDQVDAGRLEGEVPLVNLGVVEVVADQAHQFLCGLVGQGQLFALRVAERPHHALEQQFQGHADDVGRVAEIVRDHAVQIFLELLELLLSDEAATVVHGLLECVKEIGVVRAHQQVIFLQVAVCTLTNGPNGGAEVVGTGQHDHHQVKGFGPNLLEHLQTREVGHHHIEQNQVVLADLLELRECFQTASGFLERDVGVLKNATQRGANQARVIHRQHPFEAQTFSVFACGGGFWGHRD